MAAAGGRQWASAVGAAAGLPRSARSNQRASMRAARLCRGEAAQPGRFRVSAATPPHPPCGTHLRGRKSCAAGARLYLDSCRARCDSVQAVWLGHWGAIRMSVQVPGDSPAAGPRPEPGGPAPSEPGAASLQLVLTGRSGAEGFICNAVLESALALLVWAPLGSQTRLGRCSIIVWTRDTPQQKELCPCAGALRHDQ